MSASSRRARVHAGRAYFCSCGRTVFGNGGRWNHGAMHERRADGHYYLTRTEWETRRALAIPPTTEDDHG